MSSDLQYTDGKMERYETGATRSSGEGRPDYMGYVGFRALRRFGEYMLKHQRQADGSIRGSDNWKQGMDIQRYLVSFGRHVVEFGLLAENPETKRLGLLGSSISHMEAMQEVACALIFNLQGFLQETEKVREEHYGKGRGGANTEPVGDDRGAQRTDRAAGIRTEARSLGGRLLQTGEARRYADVGPWGADPAGLQHMSRSQAQPGDNAERG